MDLLKVSSDDSVKVVLVDFTEFLFLLLNPHVKEGTVTELFDIHVDHTGTRDSSGRCLVKLFDLEEKTNIW